jgi:phasin
MNGPRRPEFPADQLRGTYPIVCFDDLALEPPNPDRCGTRGPWSSALQAAYKKSFEAAFQGALLIHRETIDLTQRNVNGSFGFLRKLAGVRTLDEMLDLQTTYWRNQLDALMGQAEEVRALLTKASSAEVATEVNRKETMPEKQTFEIPQQLRELAEKNVEQARAAYGQFMDAMGQATRAWSTTQSTVLASGFNVVQERAIQFAKENAEAGFALASELAKAKDLQEVVRLQSSFAQKQMQSYARQAQDLGRLMAEATRSKNPKG